MYKKEYYKKRKRIRDKRYRDYGISKSEVRATFDYCSTSDKENKAKIKVICDSVNENISNLLFESVVYGLSFERLDGKYGIPYTKADFYAYRRKAIAQINNLRKG